MEYQIYKQEIFEVTQKLVEIDLIRLSAGNISARLPDGNVAITPSGLLYEQMKPEDIAIIDLAGNKLEGEYDPSSEHALHTEIYKTRPDIHALVHAHSRYAIAFSTVGMELPAVCLELLFVGAPIPVAEYQCPGTREVGTNAAKFFSKRPELKGLLLKNHGMVTIGKDLSEAYQNAYNLETGAKIYHLALQTGERPLPLTPIQIKDVFSRYKK